MVIAAPAGRTSAPGRAVVPPKRRRSTPLQRALVLVAALAGAAGAWSAGASPTGTAEVDALSSALVAGIVVVAASRAHRWTWLVLATGATVLAATPVTLVLALGAAAIAFVQGSGHRRPELGAIAAALAVQSVFRFESVDPHPTTTVVAVALVAPVLVSGLRACRRDTRRAVAWASVLVVVGATIASLAFAGQVAGTRGELATAVDEARAGLDAARAGDDLAAAELLEDASRRFAEVHDRSTVPWVQPARLVPVVGWHARAVTDLSRDGAALAAAAAAAARSVAADELRPVGGQIDLDAIEAATGPLTRVLDELDRALADTAELDSPWLHPVVTDQVADLEAELEQARGPAHLAVLAAGDAPGLLGADGPVSYLVLFTTPAEARGLGGFVGAWAELVVDRGAVTLHAVGRTEELNERLVADPPELDGPQDYLTRYGRFSPESHFQDVTLSPHFPQVAPVAAELYEAATGRPVDGVIALDTFALAALLELTGPVEVDGTRLDSTNAVDFLHAEQYERFDDDEAGREDLLAAVGQAAFEALMVTSLPSPADMSELLDPLMDEGRLLVDLPARDSALLTEIGATGAWPDREGGDLLAVVHQNSANNKIDVHLERTVDVNVRADPSTGQVESTVTITLHNTAPTSGLPDAVIGSNDQGLPPGTNRMLLAVHTPLSFDGARLDGEPVAVEPQSEQGLRVYSRYVTVPTGSTVAFELDLSGRIDPGDYRLTLVPQPLSRPDTVRVTVETEGPLELTPGDFAVDGVALVTDLAPRTDTVLVAPARRRAG